MNDDLDCLCGACKRLRPRDEVEMVEASDPKYGEYPLCADNPQCTIEAVARQRDEGGDSQFKVDETLE